MTLSNLPLILSALLIASEAAAAISQLLFPANQGVNGILASVIKVLQALGAKDPAAK